MIFRLTSYIWYQKSRKICGLILKITCTPYDNTKINYHVGSFAFFLLIIAWANSCGSKISFSLSSFPKFGGGITLTFSKSTPFGNFVLIRLFKSLTYFSASLFVNVISNVDHLFCLF